MRSLNNIAAAVTLVILGIGYCGSAEAADVPRGGIPPRYESLPGLEGHITVAGSDTMAPLLNQLASEFGRLHPKITIFVENTGSALAIREFAMGFSQQRRGDKSREGHDAAGMASILAASRRMTPDEYARFRSRYGYDPLEVAIAEDALAIYVHRDNPLRDLSLDQVASVFRQHGKPDTETRIWGQLGLTGEWEQQPIHLYGRDKRSGTREFFVQTVLHGAELKPDVQEAPGSASEILAISRDPLALGYAGTGFSSSYVKTLPLALTADQPAIPPSPEMIANKTYPLRRTLYLYVNQSPKEKLRNTLVGEFLRYINSVEGQEIITKAQFYPLSTAQLEANLAIVQH